MALIFEPLSADKKWCSGCNQTKDVTEFHKDKYKSDGYRTVCKECFKARRKNKYMCQEYKETFEEKYTILGYNGFHFCLPCSEKFKDRKKCSRCKEIKDLSEFGENANRRDGYNYYCNNCRREVEQDARSNKLQDKGSKQCRTCKQVKSVEEFDINLASRNKLKLNCRECEEEKKHKKEKDRTREYKECIISPAQARRITSIYGITGEDYTRMFEEQGGVCKICKRPETKNKDKLLCIDHCHKTEKVRGLHCSICNWGIGHFEDNIEYLASAIEYLKQY